MANLLKTVFLSACLVITLFEVQAQPVVGTGASFPSLVYTAWTFGYTKEKGQEVRYSATGSGEGVKKITERAVDFGASDTPLSDSELKKTGLFQFPTMAGGIVPVVNLKGIASGSLKLTGEVLADLFAGEIHSWDDARIAALNPGLALPKLKVVRIAREDSSGSTAIFTEYLSKHNPSWSSTIGVGKQVKWKSEMTMVKGNDGVKAAVQAAPGAIAYVSFDRVLRDSLTAVALRNKSGQFISPSEDAFQAAVRVSGIGRSPNLTVSLLDLEGLGIWPIVDLTYILLDASPKATDRASAPAKFFYWAFLKGDSLIKGTGFAPLPTMVQAVVVRKLGEIKTADGKALNFTQGPNGDVWVSRMDAANARQL